MTTQHEEARRLLPIIAAAARSHQTLTYQTAAEKLGRPRNNARTVAQVCDLLDGAAALADVPLLALTTVLDASLCVNPKAWADRDVAPWIRAAIIKRSRSYTFTEADFEAIGQALEKLKGYSNKRVWPYLNARDLSVVEHISRRVAILYLGRIAQFPLCSTETPEFKQSADGHWVARHLL